MRKEESLNPLPIFLPYGKIYVTMLPCYPSHEKIDSQPTGEPVRYTSSFEEAVSLLEIFQLSFRRSCSLTHDVSVVFQMACTGYDARRFSHNRPLEVRNCSYFIGRFDRFALY